MRSRSQYDRVSAEYDWLVRILLGPGTEARVLAPDDLRRWVLEAARDLAAHYAER